MTVRGTVRAAEPTAVFSPQRKYKTVGSNPSPATKKVAWCCANRVINSRAVCDSHHVNEEVLERTYLAALKELIDNAEEVIETVKEGAVLALEPVNRAEIERIAAEIMNLQEAALALHKAKQRLEIGEQDYAAKVKEYRARMKELEAKRDELQDAEVKYAEVKTWLDALIEQTMNADTLTQVDSTTMKMLVDRIIVKNEGIEVEFKCGVSIKKAYEKGENR